MNQPKTYILPIIASLGILFDYINQVPPAYADGSDKPSYEVQTEPVKDSPKQESKSQQQVFSWNLWSGTYYNNKNICREHNGNVVCLTQEAAKKVGWKAR